MNRQVNRFRGRCHCGNVEIEFTTRLSADELYVRACSCSFCSRHGARTTSDSKGSVRIVIHDPKQVIRYRFGLKTADFLVCKRCGIYAAAIMSLGDKSYATINVNTFEPPLEFAKVPAAVDYGAESEAQRTTRRERAWTPVSSIE